MPAFLYRGEQGRDLLLSAISQPRQGFGGRYLYRTIFDKAAALFYSVAKNHAFIDGNKRMGVAVLLIFLSANRYIIFATDEDLVQLVLSVVTDETSLKEVASWLRKRARSYRQMKEAITEDQIREIVPVSAEVAIRAFEYMDALGDIIESAIQSEEADSASS